MNRKFERCVGQYPVSKTLRFELIPQGKTLENIKKSGMLERDEERSKQYLIIKKMMDDYHKLFISRILSDLQLDGIQEYYELYCDKSRTEKQDKELAEMSAKFRKRISDRATKDEEYKKLFSKEMVTEILKNVAQTEEEKNAVKSFEKFTTYFTGFYENRKNMYVSEEKSTAIAYRIINQNLPKFIDNIRALEKICMVPELKEKIEKIGRDFRGELSDSDIFGYFNINNYSKIVTNEAISFYNRIIGGFIDTDGKTKIQGINEYVNLFNQKLSKNSGTTKLPKLLPLYKQILADRIDGGFTVTQFDNDQEVLDEIFVHINRVYTDLVESNRISDVFASLSAGELDKIFIKAEAISEISNKLYGDWHFITGCIEKEYDNNNLKKKIDDKYIETRRKAINKRKSYSISEINYLISTYSDKDGKCQAYFSYIDEYISEFAEQWNKTQVLLNSDYNNQHGLIGDKESVARIKDLLDSVKKIEGFMKLLLGSGQEPERDNVFYGEFEALYTIIHTITPLYNKVRNYLTRKPYSTEKIKLNFDNPTLLDGWDISKEVDNFCVLLRKDNLYYLAIMDKKNNRVMSRDNIVSDDKEYFEKMEYKLLPGPNKMLPKVIFAKSNFAVYNPPKSILDDYNAGTHKKNNDNFSVQKCHRLIDFFKESIAKNEDWDVFDFKFSNTDQYEDISQFYHEVEKQGYSIEFRNVAASYIKQLVDDGKLYLFQIYNKDFSSYSKTDSKKNLHTMYWNALFDERNLANVVYKLNGEAEVFYRKASIFAGDKNYVVHKAGEPIAKKHKAAVEKGEVSCFEYDIVKNKRYTSDKFMLHVPITMNFCAEGKTNLNETVFDIIRNNEDMCVIGIDRGERNLLYASVIDSQGRILEQIGLNVIKNDKGYSQDYHRLLDDREKQIESQKKSWKDIESIKELKEGYLSQAIHIITQLMIKYNAIVVMEDLNFGFMNGRKKVNKQVYQKFEKMLIDKLNYYVNKDCDNNEAGGIFKAYQLTNKFESFTKLGKQSGALFYIPAWNTSKIDPTTGFVDLLHPKYDNMENAIEFLQKFKSIRYNAEYDYFEFEFDYSDFTQRAEGTKTQWTVCSYGNRIVNFRNPEKNSEWDSKEINLTENFKKLFKEYGIKISDDMKKAICSVHDVTFLKKMIEGIKLVLQMRNSITGTDVDYMISPVKNAAGKFFYSEEKVSYLPENADANGAYNIARKGLWVMEQIRMSQDGKVRLAITNKEWLAYAQSHTVV